MSFLCAKKRRFQIRPQAENAELASSNALGIPRTYFLLDTIVLVYLEENSNISTGYLSANQYTILHPIIIR